MAQHTVGHRERLSIPGSPMWAPYLDAHVGDLPMSFKWPALIAQVQAYPNQSGQCDKECADDFQEELAWATHCWNQQCRHRFPCALGRQTLSKKQKKQHLGVPFSPSLCGQCMLEHEVQQKREDWDSTTSSQKSEWYYMSDEEEDEEEDEIYSTMQLERTYSGNLRFNEQYENVLAHGVLVEG